MPPSALLRPIEGPPGHDSHQASSMSLSFYSLVRPIHVRPLPRDSFTDMRRAVSEVGSVRFAERQEFYGFAVHEKRVLEIDGYCRRFRNTAPKHIHILPCNPPADVQDHKILSDNKAVDSAAHWRFRIERFYSMAFPSRLANRICPIRAPSAASSHHADFLRRRKRIIFPRCSRGIHFPLCFRNFSGTWYSITLAIAVTIPSPIHNECGRIA